MLRYVEDPACYIWYKDTNSKDSGRGQKGIIVPAPPGHGEPPLLWSRDSRSEFITFPVKAIVDNDYEGLEAEDVVTKIKQQRQTGIYMARHLLTCTEEERSVEYLQGYLEIFDPV
jgi:hypothetical protein